MADAKTKDFNEYLLENVKAAREETREFKNDIGKRMDRLENRMDKLEEKLENTRRELNQRMDKLDARMDKLEEKLDSSMKEIRDLVAASQKDIRSSKRYDGLLTSAVVSATATAIFLLLLRECW